MVARDLSEAKPLWRPEGRREGECLPGSLSHGEGLRKPKACRRAKASLEARGREGGREGGRNGGTDSRGKRERGGERSERDGHRGQYRQHRRNSKTSPEA